MPLAESLFAKLSTAPAATAALVGEGSAAKIYPVIAREDTAAPYIAWQEIASTPDLTLGEAIGSRKTLVQFSCVGRTYLEARNLGAAVKADLDNQTLAALEVVLSVSDDDGYSEATDQFLRTAEAIIFVPS